MMGVVELVSKVRLPGQGLAWQPSETCFTKLLLLVALESLKNNFMPTKISRDKPLCSPPLFKGSKKSPDENDQELTITKFVKVST